MNRGQLSSTQKRALEWRVTGGFLVKERLTIRSKRRTVYRVPGVRVASEDAA